MRIGPYSSATVISKSRISGVQNPSSHFEKALTRASNRHTVQRGETLSEIVHHHLKARGRSTTAPALYAAVERIARANGIANPDFIAPGQTIDLAILNGKTRSAGAATTPDPGAHSRPARARARFEDIDLAAVTENARVSSRFGLRRDPINGDIRFHRGMDLAAPKGTPITAIADGEVIFAGWHGGHGRTVIVRHRDGTESLYAHADGLLVQPGQRVSKETPLALVGDSGRATGPHVHLEVHRGGRAVNPEAYLVRNSARYSM